VTCDKGAAPDWKSVAACIEVLLAAIGVFPVVAVHLCDCRFSLCDHGGLLNNFSYVLRRAAASYLLIDWLYPYLL
jgi:hypothetical protein